MDGPASSRFELETIAIRQLQTAMADAEAALGRRLGLNSTDLAALAHVTWAEVPIGPSELVRFLNVSAGAVTDVVDRLTAAGYLERRRDLVDRRRVRLHPTVAASSAMSGLIMPLIQGVDADARALSHEHRTIILQFLARVTRTYGEWTEHTLAHGSGRLASDTSSSRGRRRAEDSGRG